MSPEEREMLRRSIALAEENNDILRKIQRSMRLASLMRAIYWVFIIGSAIGAYYLIQPYIQSLTGTYTGAKSSFDSNINDFLKNLNSQ